MEMTKENAVGVAKLDTADALTDNREKKSAKRQLYCDDLNPKESLSKRSRTEPIVREIAVKRYKS